MGIDSDTLECAFECLSKLSGPGVVMETKLKVLVEKLADLHSKVRYFCRPSVGDVCDTFSSVLENYLKHLNVKDRFGKAFAVGSS